MKDGAFLDYIGYGQGVDIKSCKSISDFKKGDSCNLPFDDNSFDVVVSLETLEHVSDLDNTLDEIKRVLKPGGFLILSTPNNYLLWRSIWFVWENTFGKEWMGTHHTKDNKKKWVRKLSKYFEIDKIESFYGLLLVMRMRNNK